MKSKKQKLRIEADKLLQEKAIEKYGNKCEICPGTFRIGGHHIFSRQLYSHLRYDLDNIAVLCSYCHIIRLHSQGDPLILEKIKAKRKKGWFERLKKKAQQRPKSSWQTVGYYEQILQELSKLR